MAQDILDRTLTKADFHAFMAEEPEGRFEFENGRIIDMTGGTGNHSYIGTRFVTAIARQIDEELWAVHGPDRGVDMPDSVRYPDAMVEAQPFDGAARWTTTPALLVEVLSPSSGKRDLVTKAAEYTALPTMQAYIVAEPDEACCYVWVRDRANTFAADPIEVSGATGVILIPSLGLTLRLGEIYRHLLQAR